MRRDSYLVEFCEQECLATDTSETIGRIRHGEESDEADSLSDDSNACGFYIPRTAVYPFVDHVKPAYLPFGLALGFVTDGVAGAAH